MFIDDETRVRHMAEAAEEIRAFVSKHERPDLDVDIFVTRGLIRTLETIGEAASRLSREFRDSHSTIPWRNWISLRNYLAHDYHSYDYDRIWQVATSDVEDLSAALVRIIDDLR